MASSSRRLGEGQVLIKPGVNTITITNTAVGLIEICKVRSRASADAQPTFQFRIDSGAIITVHAGTCSPPSSVSVGNHTVTEVAAATTR